MVMRMKMAVFWDVVLCSLVEFDWHFRGAYCPHHQGDQQTMQHNIPEENYETVETYELTVKKVEKNSLLKRSCGVMTPDILARKSWEGSLPYCKTRDESEGFSQRGL
jgi:hypothetical protein